MFLVILGYYEVLNTIVKFFTLNYKNSIFNDFKILICIL